MKIQLVKNNSTGFSKSVTNGLTKLSLVSNLVREQCSDIVATNQAPKPGSSSVICCTSSFDTKNKNLAVVTISMVLEFAPGGVAIDPRYYADFKKIANFFRDSFKIKVFFDGYTLNSHALNGHPLTTLRFKNMVEYLFENFDISLAKLYPLNSNDSIHSGETNCDSENQNNYFVTFLFDCELYQHFNHHSIVH